MSLSRKVKQQEQELEALEQQLYGNKPAEGSDTPQAEPPATDAQPAEAPAAPEQAPATPEPAPAPVVSEETWEQRYKVLQGKYNAEVPNLQRELRALTDTVKTLKEKAEQAPPEKLVKPEEVDQYGEQFIDMVQRAAEEKFGPERAQLLSKIAVLEERLNGVAGNQEQAAQATFFADLAKAAPDWEAVDKEEGWKVWLAQYDPEARRVRQNLLDDALVARDAPYVAAMISKWKAQRQARAKPSLETLAAPSTQKTPPPEAPAKKTWTKAEVDAFYREASKPRNSKYSEEEAARIEQDIESAVREGRYRG